MLVFAQKMMTIDAGNDEWLGSVEKSLFDVQKVIKGGERKTFLRSTKNTLVFVKSKQRISICRR